MTERSIAAAFSLTWAIVFLTAHEPSATEIFESRSECQGRTRR